jgi:hypothetical protein
MGADLVETSRLVARDRLHGLPARLAHVAGVSARLSRAAALVPADLRTLTAAAAWLHDIGYAPSVRRTGFHPLDGARFLEANGYPGVVCQLVGHHSGAEYEATVRGLGAELAQFPMPEQGVLDLLTWADMTTSPTGATVSLAERVEEILLRYPESDPVHQAITAARPTLAGAVQRVEARLGNLIAG